MDICLEKMINVPSSNYKFWENRMHVKDIINGLKIPYDSPASVVDIYHVIVGICKIAKKKPTDIEWALIDNVLHMNGVPIKRIAPHVEEDLEDSDYWYEEDM